jgi:Histidine kinase
MNDTVAHPPPSSPRVYWTTQILGWGLYGGIQSFGAITYVGATALRAGLEALALYGAGLFLTHGLRRFMRQRHWDVLRWPALTLRIFLAGLTFGAVIGFAEHFTVLGKLRELETVGGPSTPTLVVVALRVVNWSAIFWSWCALYFVILTARRRRWAELRQSELARALQLAELRLLKSQLNPHFLFNSLNSVRALIAVDVPRAQKAVTQLARTLRYTLSAGQEELVSLQEELTIVEDYLGLESLRLGERLRIDWQFAEETKAVRIPVMLLQTVVENAIKHGIAELPQGGTLRIAGELRHGALLLEVENPRPVSVARPAGEGVGLRNAAERLRLLFGPEAQLNLDLSVASRAIARIRIPVRA